MYASPIELYVNTDLPRHYESDEEAISEYESHDHKRSATLDSIMSVPSEPSVDERPQSQLLSPFTTRPSRPVSMDTVKRSSSATFVTEPCTIFDHDNDDEMILELPSPDPTTPLQSPIFLQPTVYVPSEPLDSPRNSFSSSSSSLYSDDASDVFVAEQVTYVEHAKPNIVLISPTASQEDSPSPSPTSDSSGSVYSNDGAAKSQPLLGETSMDRGRQYYPQRPLHGKAQGSLSALDTLKNYTRPSDEPMSAPALEAPRPLSMRARSMSFTRPQTPVSDPRRRLQKEPSRPPSSQSTATFSLFPSQTYSQPLQEEPHARSISTSHSAASSTYSLSTAGSRTASPNPCYNRSRSGSLYSISSLSTSTTGKRPLLPYRGSMMKSSTLRNESVDAVSEVDQRARSQSQSQTEDLLKSKTRRMKSMKQPSPGAGSREKDRKGSESSSASSAKSFVGFMLRGKRKSVVNK